jgi:hypothetical protein
MNTHPQATALAAAVADRDSVQLAAVVTDTVRLRALLPCARSKSTAAMPSSPALAGGSPTWTPSTWWSRQARRWPTGS